MPSLSFAQAATFAEAAADGVCGKLQAVLSLRGDWDEGEIQEALDATVGRHAILRTIYPGRGADRNPVVLPDRGLRIDRVRIRTADSDAPIVDPIDDFSREKHDPARDTPLRVGLISGRNNESVLVLTLSEFVSDPGAQGTLVFEIVRALFGVRTRAAVEWPASGLAYLEYAAEERRLYDERIGPEVTEQLAQKMPRWERESTHSATHRTLASGTLQGPDIPSLLQRCRLENVSPQVVALTAAAALDGQEKGKQESHLLLPFSRRAGRTDLLNTIGPFQDEQILALQWAPADSYRDLLWQVRSQLPRLRDTAQAASAAIMRSHIDLRPCVPPVLIDCAPRWGGHDSRADEPFRASAGLRSVALYAIARRSSGVGPMDRCDWTVGLRPERNYVRIEWTFQRADRLKNGCECAAEYARILGSLLENPAARIGN